MIKENEGYIFYDDTCEPRLLDAKEIRTYINEGYHFINLAEETNSENLLTNEPNTSVNTKITYQPLTRKEKR